MGILKPERILKSLRRLCAIITIIYDLLHNHILTNNNYDLAVNRTCISKNIPWHLVRPLRLTHLAHITSTANQDATT